ncbi:polyprotein-like [Trifolium medium]|uniref:Polyprotein-like n=1 Tax=Trifolium medium TaxID=97028 RepID=A0A392N564_9FABA|nr:polyprotein-like [Trifolium medium]
MDVYSAADRLQILPRGIKFKRNFKAYTDTKKLFSLVQTPPGYHEIKAKLLKLCADSHEEFNHPNPLWKNKEFFIQLPFKLNEDINPTKATHPGMSPSDYTLAKKECDQLLKQGLIEPTKSEWACQAFYVEKRSEKIRGKKRLVIDYKPLNHFLRDDKFPIRKTATLNTFIKDAQIYSKFDMKSGFWQLGIDPKERYKTAFCIPNAQYQWTILPFGLKIAPSLFQKAMTRIF